MSAPNKQKKQPSTQLIKIEKAIEEIRNEMTKYGFSEDAIDREGLKLWFHNEGLKLMIHSMYKLAEQGDHAALIKYGSTMMSYVMPKAADVTDDKKSYTINIVAPDSFIPIRTTNPSIDELYPKRPMPDTLAYPTSDDDVPQIVI